MPHAAPRRRLLGRGSFGAVLLTGMLAGIAGPVGAVDPIPGVPIPSERPAVDFPLPVTDAIAVDLDGDGVRELLAVSAATRAQGLSAVQAWWVDGEGAAEPSNQVRLRRSASVDELLSGRGRLGIDQNDMIAVRTSEPARLMTVNRDGRPVVLVATIGTETEFDVPCCLTIWEVAVSGRQLELRLVAETQRYAAQLIAADMDGDGTDELFVTEGPATFEEGTPLDVGFLRWTGDRFARQGIVIESVEAWATVLAAGESDGVPGEEILMQISAPEQEGGLLRVSLRGGELAYESAFIGYAEAAEILALAGGPSVLTGDGFSTLSLWSWPRDREPERAAFRTTGGALQAVFGTGSETRLLVGAGRPPGSILVVPGDLGDGAGYTSEFGRDIRSGVFVATVLQASRSFVDPFFGVIPGGLPGDAGAFVFFGELITTDADPTILATTRSIALLPGLEPVGTVGPGGRSVGLMTFFPENVTPDVAPTPPTEATDVQFGTGPRSLRLVATASVLEPEVDGGDLSPTFFGAAPHPERPTNMIVGNEAVEAEITGPIGTTVGWSTRGEVGEGQIGPGGVVRIPLLEAAGPDAPDGSGATVSIWLVTPAGHAYSGTWRIDVYRQPPDIGISDEAPLLDLDPTVSGETIPGATVTINGEPVAVDADGSFDAPVDVGLLPTELRIVVTDPVGNQTTRVISRVWPLDYRQLPFVPIAVLLTVAAGLALFLRKPDGGPSRRPPDEHATFEEIGG